jgi:tRNA threonylcarbamoyladenosine biosynthesis protein TsaE
VRSITGDRTKLLTLPAYLESASESQTREAGLKILRELLLPSVSAKNAVVVALTGDLGAGKTQLTKGIAEGLGIPAVELHSPTFSLANEYDVTIPEGGPGQGRLRFNHLDAYRFEDPDELLELGIEDYLYAPNTITIIEWAERVEKYLPSDVIRISIETVAETLREIRVFSSGI